MALLKIGPDDGLYYEHDPAPDGAPTIVFVNALTGSTGAWQGHVAPACRAAGFGTLCYNFRGQVDSPLSAEVTLSDRVIVDDLKLILAELKPARPVLCGLSIGGLYAARAVLEGSEAAGLILLNTLRRIGPRLRWVNDATFHAARVGGFPLMLDMMLPLLTNPDFLEAARPNHIQTTDYIPEDPSSGHYRLMETQAGTHWDVPWQDLRLPVLTITGLCDRVFHDADVVAELRALLPDGRHQDWPDCGHLIPAERPERLAESVIGFANSL
ncbi:MAG: alpha/beta fold hydrolase [Minwuia sp.]|uniref:alpha/beta fold hydrolase n=1 Tax=Minwuia sp. TaxID=2493630 RepID=UPI003A8868BA